MYLVFIVKFCFSFVFFLSDRTIPNLDTLVPFDSTKAYDILDVIYPVSNKHFGCLAQILIEILPS